MRRFITQARFRLLPLQSLYSSITLEHMWPFGYLPCLGNKTSLTQETLLSVAKWGVSSLLNIWTQQMSLTSRSSAHFLSLYTRHSGVSRHPCLLMPSPDSLYCNRRDLTLPVHSWIKWLCNAHWIFFQCAFKEDLEGEKSPGSISGLQTLTLSVSSQKIISEKLHLTKHKSLLQFVHIAKESSTINFKGYAMAITLHFPKKSNCKHMSMMRNTYIYATEVPSDVFHSCAQSLTGLGSLCPLNAENNA